MMAHRPNSLCDELKLLLILNIFYSSPELGSLAVADYYLMPIYVRKLCRTSKIYINKSEVPPSTSPINYYFLIFHETKIFLKILGCFHKSDAN